MDGDRKYKQRGYMDDFTSSGSDRYDDRPRPPRPKLPLDVTGPRLPRMVETVTASRCYNCAVTLPAGFDFKGKCPKCEAELHCCKQCTYFEPATRFQCHKPVPERIPVKDAANECTFFRARVTVARDSAPAAAIMPATAARPETLEPKSAIDARIAFDNLFKK